MASGISLHIGLNRVDDSHYRKNLFEGWSGELKGCESDALALAKIAEDRGFDTNILLTRQATRANVKSRILNASEDLFPGDFFFITYSGHGSQVRDRSQDEMLGNDTMGSGRDRHDETWCLFDAQLIDDELHELWSKFKPGVRILIFSDSCHSGTISRDPDEEEPLPPGGMGFRLIPRASLNATKKVHNAFYDSLQSEPGIRPQVEARVLLFSGCQDEELSREDQSEDAPGGLFTKSIVQTWTPGKFADYKSFFEAIKTNMPDDKQSPNFHVFGGDSEGFELESPLELND